MLECQRKKPFHLTHWCHSQDVYFFVCVPFTSGNLPHFYHQFGSNFLRWCWHQLLKSRRCSTKRRLLREPPAKSGSASNFVKCLVRMGRMGVEKPYLPVGFVWKKSASQVCEAVFCVRVSVNPFCADGGDGSNYSKWVTEDLTED